MLDNAVEALAGRFVQRVRTRKDDSFIYLMDESVHSLSLLDMYFDRNLYPESDNEYAYDIILASAYTGVVCYKNLKSSGFKTRLSLTSKSDKTPPTILLGIDNDDATETCRIDITDTLTTAILKPTVIEFSRLYKIPPGFMKRKIWLTCLGILTLLHQDYELAKSIAPEDIDIHILKLCENIAKEYSVKYTSILPDKEKLFDSRIFSFDLTYPPPGVEEKSWHQSSLLRFASLLKKNEISLETLSELSTYLIESSNFHHATFAATVLASLQSSSEKYLVSELMHQFPLLPFHLLPSIEAFINIRGTSFSIENLKKHLAKTENTEAQEIKQSVQHKIFLNLSEMGFFPLLCCPDISLIDEQKYTLYLETLIRGHINEAYELGNIILRGQSTTPPASFLLQHAWLLLQYNKGEELKEIFKMLPGQLSKSESWTSKTIKLLSKAEHETLKNNAFTLLEEGIKEHSFPSHEKLEKLLFEGLSICIEKAKLPQLLELIEGSPSSASLHGFYTLRIRFPDYELPLPRHLRRAYWSTYRFNIQTNMDS